MGHESYKNFLCVYLIYMREIIKKEETIGRAHITCEEVTNVYKILVRHGVERLLCIPRQDGKVKLRWCFN